MSELTRYWVNPNDMCNEQINTDMVEAYYGDEVRAEIERLTQECQGLAATQCDDPIFTEYGHVLCGTVKERDRRIEQLQQENDRLRTELAQMRQNYTLEVGQRKCAEAISETLRERTERLAQQLAAEKEDV